MSREVREVQRFTAYDDAGNEYVLIAYAPYYDRVSGKRDIKTLDGRAVDRKGKGVYTILDFYGAKMVRSNDPYAP